MRGEGEGGEGDKAALRERSNESSLKHKSDKNACIACSAPKRAPMIKAAVRDGQAGAGRRYAPIRRGVAGG